MQSILKMSAVGAVSSIGATCVSALEGNFNQPHYKDGSRLDVCFAFGPRLRPATCRCVLQGTGLPESGQFRNRARKTNANRGGRKDVRCKFLCGVQPYRLFHA